MAFGLPIWFALMLGLAGALGLAALARPKAVWAVLSAFIAGNAGQLGLTDPLWVGSLLMAVTLKTTVSCCCCVTIG